LFNGIIGIEYVKYKFELDRCKEDIKEEYKLRKNNIELLLRGQMEKRKKTPLKLIDTHIMKMIADNVMNS
jgi:hypothetical protein